MANASWPEAILFDLDGTLIDSAPDIAAATNSLLAGHDLPPLAVNDVRKMIGNGVRKLVERAYAHHGRDLSETELDSLFAEMMQVYGDNLVNLTVLYDGVEALLRDLQSQGKKLAIVTNKPECFTREIIAHFGWTDLFGSIVGGDTLPTRKPQPEMLFHALNELDVEPRNVIMVGDSAADIDSARNAEIKSVAIRGGYTLIPADDLGADQVLDRISDLQIAIDRLK